MNKKGARDDRYNWVLVIVATSICFFLLTGCANLDMVEQNKKETEYRKQTHEYVERQKSRKQNNQLSGPIEMPQEWLDQWSAQGEAE